jgi:hypothetical protein
MIIPHPDNSSQKAHVALLLLAGFLFILPSLNDGLVSDDYELIEEGRITGVEDVWTFFTEPGHKGFYRPIPRLLLGANQAVHGLSPFGYHLLNAVLHLAMSLAVYRLACRISRHPGISLATSVLFAVHFIHVEPVYWVSARNELLVALIYISILLLILRSDLKSSMVAWGLFLLGLWCKETAITIPFVVGILGMYRETGSPRDRVRQGIRVSFPFWLILTGYASLRWSVGADWPWTSQEIEFGVHPFLILKNMGQYTIQLLIPVRSLLDMFGSDTYAAMTRVLRAGGPISTGLLLIILSIAFILVTIIGALFKTGGPTARIGLTFALLTALPYLLMQGTGLRYMYLPSAGFLLAFVVGAKTVMDTWGKSRFTRRHLYLMTLPVALSLLVTLDQTRWWDQAGRIADRVVEQVGAKATVPGIPLYVFNIPRRLHGVYIFHNGFEAAMRLYRLKSTSGIYDGDRRLDQNGVIPDGVAVFHLGHIEGF